MDKWDRLWEQTEDNGECWEWTGYNTRGYGRMRWEGKMRLVTHIVYERFIGPIPPGHVIKHECDNPPCVNPDHLMADTQLNNILDAFERGRLIRPKGEAHYNAKITAKIVQDIRERISAGERSNEVARQYGIHRYTVERIARRETWKHVP